MSWPLAVATLASAGAQYMGASHQNSAMRDAANSQMAFQERMSSTAHQREVADLKAAGLNPILSAGGPGASSPGGASYSPVNTVEGAANSALDVVRLKKDIEEADSRIDMNNANAASLRATLPKKELISEGFKAGKALLDKTKKSIRPGYFDAWKKSMKGMFKRKF